jgi:hypothetical protein
VDLRKIVWKVMDRIHLAQVRAIVNMVNKSWSSIKGVDFSRLNE